MKRALKLYLALTTINTLGIAQETQGSLIRAKKFVEAEVLCRKDLEAQPGDPKALVNLGLCLEGEGKRREAMHHWGSLRSRSIEGVPTDKQLEDRISTLWKAELSPHEEKFSTLPQAIQARDASRSTVAVSLATPVIAVARVDIGKYDHGSGSFHVCITRLNGNIVLGELDVSKELAEYLEPFGRVMACEVVFKMAPTGQLAIERAEILSGIDRLPLTKIESTFFDPVGQWVGRITYDSNTYPFTIEMRRDNSDGHYRSALSGVVRVDSTHSNLGTLRECRFEAKMSEKGQLSLNETGQLQGAFAHLKTYELLPQRVNSGIGLVGTWTEVTPAYTHFGNVEVIKKSTTKDGSKGTVSLTWK